MRAKTFIPVFAITIILLCTYFLVSRTSSPANKKISIENARLMELPPGEKFEETSGPQQILRHEYLMTLDPATKEVPTERLKAAEDLLASQSMNERIESSNIIWQERGPSNVGGRTRAVLIDKSDGTGNTVWAGGVGGGLWKTTNFKTTCTWTQVAGISATTAITCIAQHPSTFGVIYVGTGEGFSNIDAIRGLGVYRTLDGGTNWTLLASTTTGGASVSNFYFVNKLLVYTNGDVYAATRSNFCNTGGGIMKSTDQGGAWTRVIGTSAGSCAASADAYGFDIEMSLSGDLYAATRTPNSTGKIWKSLAGGTVGNLGTWTNVTPAGTFQRIELACSPTNNNKVYALTQGATSATGGTRLTTDGGTNWSTIDVGTWCDQGSSNPDFTRNQAWYDLILGIKPTDDATVYAGGIDIFKTTNSGTAWTQITQWNAGCGAVPVVHADIHAFEFFPGSPDEFIVGCDGGLFYTTNGGTSFTNKNNGYNVTQYYGVAIHPTSGSNHILGGAQDNGSHRFSAAGINSVTTVSGGDGAFCHIDTDNPLFQFTSFTGATFNRSTNGGTSFTFIISQTADRFINPSDYDAANDNMYYGGTARNLRRALTITTAPVTAIFTNVASTTNHSVSAVKVDPNTAHRVWVAFSTADGAVALATPELYFIDAANSGAPTITTVTLPAGIATSGNYISSIDIETGNAAHILLTLSNYGVNSVWESTNTGGTWTSIENGSSLPDIPVRWGKFLPAGFSPNSRVEAIGGILLATELGVWSTNAVAGGGTVWVINNTGMGNVRTDMIQLRTSDNTIAVATHGRGMFTGVNSPALPVVLAEFKGTIQNKKALLQWKTASENNSKHFELEKSLDGINFRKIATIAAAGNSSSLRQYSYPDPEVLVEMNYYRLRSVDIDDQSKLSNTVLLKVPGVVQDMQLLGNPFKNTLTIRFVRSPEVKGELRLTDMAGRLVAKRVIGQGEQLVEWKLPSGAMASGTYVLQAFINGRTYTSKVVKE